MPPQVQMVAALLALVLLLAPGALGQGTSIAAPTDAELLLDLKGTFSNGESLLESWHSSAGEPCNPGNSTWLGVNCSSAGRVISM
jgi:hypothetical protein